MFDVAIIGAGIVGGMTARLLSQYDLKICIIEKENDVSMGATKANSAIVHAGFDAENGTLKAILNVKGTDMMPEICKELGVDYLNNGSLVIGFNDEDRKTINELYKRGINNGVKNLEVIEQDRLKELEPNISHNAICALYAPTSAIVSPFELAVAAIGNAMDNGAELKLNFEVDDIRQEEGLYVISSRGEEIKAKYVINAAGLFADRIAQMVGDSSFSVHPRLGEYILLDKECGNLAVHTVFRTPTVMGKGILVSPTIHGNLLLGPTSVDTEDKENTQTTSEGFAKIIKEAAEDVEGIPFNKTITSFAGLRPVGDSGDFILNSPVKNFINAAGIESPGVSASPAIAEYILELLKQQGIELIPRSDFNPYRKPAHYFRTASLEEKNEIIRKDSSFGRVICRCETVTEGEIIEACRMNPRPADLDGVKRRTRAQMGRCQGGFCMPYVTEILAKELCIPYEKVTKCGGDSVINFGKTKEGMAND